MGPSFNPPSNPTSTYSHSNPMKSKYSRIFSASSLPAVAVTHRQSSIALATVVCLLVGGGAANAATIYWDGTATAWNLAANWSTAIGAATPNPAAVPGSADVANFSISSINVAQTVDLIADRSVQGLVFLGTNTTTTLLQGGGANRVLTLGTNGISVNASAGAVTIGGSTTGQFVSTTLGAGNQNWVNNSSTTLTFLNGVNRNAGHTLNISGSIGTPVTATTATAFANNIDTGIVGTWASFGTGVDTKYATKDGLNQIVGLTGAAAETGSDLTDTTGFVNYDLAAGGGTVPDTVSANTIRYTGAADSLAPGATSFTLNGLMNSGSGVLSLGSNTLTIGSDFELVANAANADIAISSIIQNNGVTASTLIKTGPGVLTLSGANTYTNGTTVNLGTLALGGDNSAVAGTTNVRAGGTLRVGGSINIPAGNLNLVGSTTSAATLDLRNDVATTFTKNVVLNGGVAGLHAINVDQAVGGSGTDGNHILNSVTNGGAVAARTLTVSGANGYGLTIGNFSMQGGTGQTSTVVANVNVTLSDVTNPMSGFASANFGTLAIAGTSTGSSITGVIEDAVGGSLAAGGYTVVSKSGTGTWALDNAANSFTGQLQVSDGIVTVSSIADSGTASAAGAGSSIRVGNFGATGNLVYTGGAQSTNRQVVVGNGANTTNTGGASIKNNGGGALTFTNPAFNLATSTSSARTLNLDGTYTATANEIQGVIADNTGAGAVITVSKTGDGTWILSGANTFTGQLQASSGILSIVSLADSGVASAAGAGISMRVGSFGASGTISYTGGTQSTNRQVQIGNGATQTGGGAIQNNGTGALTFTNAAFNIANTTTGERTLALDGTYTGATNVIQGIIADNTGAIVGITKSGAGTWAISGVNTYTGDTTVTGGSLAVNGTSIIDSGKLVIDGGTVDLTGAETVGTLFFGAVQQPAGTYSQSGGVGITASANFTGAGTLTVTSSPVASPYDAWATSKGLTGVNGGTSADPDFDGVSNLVEFVLGGEPNPANPGSNSTGLLPVVTTPGGDLVFTFTRDAQSKVSQVALTIQVGSDLVSFPTSYTVGNDTVTSSAGVTVTPSGGNDIVTLTVARSPDPKKFARLNAVYTAP